MKVDFNNYNNQKEPSFGIIHYDSAEDAIKNILNTKELEEFRQLIKKHKDNKIVHLRLFGNNNNKKLSANVFDDNIFVSGWLKSYNQRIFESGMGFIKRMIKKVEKRTPEVEELVEKQNFNF